jgi:FixJ family two-component response regulator
MIRLVLVVSPSAEARTQRVEWFQDAGFLSDAVATFEEGREWLANTHPDVLVTDVRLDGYNGLHLAIVGLRRRFTRAAVAIGAPDPALAKEAGYHGIGFLSEPFTRQALLDCIRERLGTHPGRAPVEKAKTRPSRVRVISSRRSNVIGPE